MDTIYKILKAQGYRGNTVTECDRDRFRANGLTDYDVLSSKFEGNTKFECMLNYVRSLGMTEEFSDRYEIEHALYPWADEEVMTLTAITDGSIGLYCKNNTPNLSYSINSQHWVNWTEQDFDTIEVKAGTSVRFIGINNYFSLKPTAYSQFTLDGTFIGTGSILSLLEAEHHDIREVSKTYCFYRLFKDCEGLITAPDLLATSVGKNAYSEMFSGCRNLQYIKCLLEGMLTGTETNLWMEGTPDGGSFIRSRKSFWPGGESGIKTSWNIIVE